MGLRDYWSLQKYNEEESFNLPEGRDGFKSNVKITSLVYIAKCFNLPEGRDGFKSYYSQE